MPYVNAYDFMFKGYDAHCRGDVPSGCRKNKKERCGCANCTTAALTYFKGDFVRKTFQKISKKWLTY